MANIVLTTLNARYAHASFGLRYLLANLGELQAQAEIVEFEISQRPVDMLEILLARNPKIIGVGVYIWNIDQVTRLVADLKRVRPDIVVILGGPEVSYETDQVPVVRDADYVICGEADLTLPEVCSAILRGVPPTEKIIPARLPQFSELKLPYHLYDADDIAHRVIYVEASRGCPYECEFCLSALDIPVRQATLETFLEAMDGLFLRGVRQFKFVDRTFNLNMRVSRAILQFFLDRYEPGLFLHFEMIPDRLPDSLRDLIRKFPAGALQFEVGIQTFNEEIAARISRRQDAALVEQNLNWLHAETGVHVHADLIVGLPGEDLDSFGEGFDRLVRLNPQEIQVGILKRLRGTPIVRHDAEWGMIYSPAPPYEILQTKQLDFNTLHRLRRFARYWDLVANSGNFLDSTPLLWGGKGTDSSPSQSPFHEFLAFSDWLHAVSNQTHAIALKRLAELLFEYLTQKKQLAVETVAQAVWADYRRGNRSDLPPFLRPYIHERVERSSLQGAAGLPVRQSRRVVP